MIDVKNINVSYFKDFKDFQAKTVTLASILEKLQTEGSFPKVHQLHQQLFGREYNDWDEFDNFKKELKKSILPDCWTPSCVIAEGQRRCDANIQQLNPIISLDLDNKDQTDDMQEEFKHLKETLCEYPWIVYCGESLSATGYFILALIDNTDKQLFKLYYEELTKTLEGDGWVCDRATSSPSNFRFVSFDPEPYINLEAEPFHVDVEQVMAERKAVVWNKDFNLPTDRDVKSEYEKVVETISQNSIVIDDEKDWFDLGMSLADVFGEAGRALFHQLSCTSCKYQQAYLDRKFNWFLRHSQHRHTLGTFYFILEKYGIKTTNNSSDI